MRFLAKGGDTLYRMGDAYKTHKDTKTREQSAHFLCRGDYGAGITKVYELIDALCNFMAHHAPLICCRGCTALWHTVFDGFSIRQKTVHHKTVSSH